MFFCACYTELPRQLSEPPDYQRFYGVECDDPLRERFAVVLGKRLFIFLVLEYPVAPEQLTRLTQPLPMEHATGSCNWRANQQAVELFFEAALDISLPQPVEQRLRAIREAMSYLKENTGASPYIHNLYWRILWLYEKIRLEFDFYKIPADTVKAFSQLVNKIYDPNTHPQLALAGNSAALHKLFSEVGRQRFSRVLSYRAGQKGQVVSLLEKLSGDIFLIGDDIDNGEVINHLKRQQHNTRLPILIICTSTVLQKHLEKKNDMFCYTLEDLEKIVGGYRKERENLIRQTRLLFREETDAFFNWSLSGKTDNFFGIISRHPSMYAIFETIVRVAPNNITVLIEGASGTGKELIARAIHRLSSRKRQPFITVNCSAIPDNLLESELFGHVKGAFTGAVVNKTGLFQEANNGTIFLDEIGELSESIQVKLLRFLQNGEIRPVGGNQTIHIDARLITATNRDLNTRVSEGLFRSDFYYRLNVVKLTLPPLNERTQDIASLTTHFIRLFSQKFNKEVNGIDNKALKILFSHSWPGNIRELENVIEHACAMALGPAITPEDLPQLPGETGENSIGGKTLKEMEAEHIRRALSRFDSNHDAVCRELGISRTTLWRKLKELGIS